MKILVRKLGDKVYEWLDAKYTKNYFVVDGKDVSEVDIVSVMDDDRTEYVKCSCCGELLKKGSAEIEAHQNKYKDCKACFDCKYLRDKPVKNIDIKYELQEDGTYLAKKNLVVSLRCGASYWSDPIIHTDEARECCAFRGCTNADLVEVEDIFTEKPCIFDDIITIDKIVEVGYKTATNGHEETFYRLKGRNEIYAVVNKMNVVDHFAIEYRGNSWNVYYSKKYDEFYYCGRNGKYTRYNFSSMPDTTREYIKNKIAKLYA